MVRNSLAVCFVAFNLFLFAPAAMADDPAPVTVITTPGGDDSSYQIPLTVSVVYDGVSYQNVYATTNSVITFGRPDGTFWTYPQTPSISIESRDWWALPYVMADTHFIISVSEGGFQVDGAYRPYGSYSGDITNIVITAQIQTSGSVSYTYVVNGPLWGDERTGARLTNGLVVTLDEAGVTQIEEIPVLQPEPVPPTPEPTPTPTPGPTPEPSPEPSPTPSPSPEPSPEPTPSPAPEPTPQPAPAPAPEPEPIAPPAPEPVPVVEPEPESIPELPPLPQPEPAPLPAPEPPIEEKPIVAEPLEEGEVLLDNGVVLSASQAIAVELLSNPGELIQEIFTDPMAALAALGQVGADMSPEVRERSEEVVVAAVIVGNIASAAGAAAYRRKP